MQIEDYPRFFEEITGNRPFPWQQRFAEQLCREGWGTPGQWSPTCVAPTGTGKTERTVLGNLFALAWRLERGLPHPRRLYWIVDRRQVVDEVHILGTVIEAALKNAPEGSVSAQVAQQLLRTGSKEPFKVVRERGGVFRDRGWMTDPRTPLLVSTTVDQMGSGVLFRKYGAPRRNWPLYAGIMSTDAVLVSDEAHLSEPFMRVVDILLKTSGEYLHAAKVSATSEDGSKSELDSADLKHPVLGPRLRLPKEARLVPCETDGKLAATLAKEAQTLASEHGLKVIAVVCNRVKTARKVFETLRKKKGEAVLITGRSRQHDRDRVMEGILPFVSAKKDRPSPEKVLYVVSTQCIEAGANFDFEGMVTVCAPIDSLVQRAGRLGRLGLKAVYLVIVQAPKDTVYEGRAEATWEWLVAQDRVDFGWEGQEAMFRGHEETLAGLRAPRPDSPYLSTDIVHTLSQTSPGAYNAPTLEQFLHGYGRSPDVTLLWRSDLGDNPDDWAEILSLFPPVPAETMQVPIWAFTEFLRKPEGADDVADVADMLPSTEKKDAPTEPVLRWGGVPEESTTLTNTREVRPGDVLVLPCSRGGCDEYGWTGRASDIPSDLANEALAKTRTRRVRLHVGLPDEQRKLLSDELEESNTVRRDPLRSLLDAHPLGDMWKGDLKGVELTAYPAMDGVVVYDKKGRPGRPRDYGDEASTSSKAEVLLAAHNKDVGHWASIYARELLDDDHLVEDLELAGVLHDLGKADPRWQRFIYAGMWAPGYKVLAKPRGRPDWQKCALPKRLRHEMGSLMVAEIGQILDRAHDPELVAVLVATHHGLSRPFAPALDDSSPVSYSCELVDGTVVDVPCSTYPYAKVDSGWADRQLAVARRIGPWRLAQLELVLRMADWRASGEAEEKTDD